MFHHQARKLTLAFVGAAAASTLVVSSVAFAATPTLDRATTVQIDDDPNPNDNLPEPSNATADIQVQAISYGIFHRQWTYNFKVKNLGPDKMQVFLDGSWCASRPAGGVAVCVNNGVVDYYVTLDPGQSRNVSFLCDPTGYGATLQCDQGTLHAKPVGKDPNWSNNKRTIHS